MVSDPNEPELELHTASIVEGPKPEPGESDEPELELEPERSAGTARD